MANEVRVWDLPTRLFHWSLAACVIGLVITGSIGGGVMQWHARLGYVVLTLLLFRICWGFLGGRWSRFSSFLHSPRTVLARITLTLARAAGSPYSSVTRPAIAAPIASLISTVLG